jgi:hypothetical protein
MVWSTMICNNSIRSQTSTASTLISFFWTLVRIWAIETSAEQLLKLGRHNRAYEALIDVSACRYERLIAGTECLNQFVVI